MKMTSPLAKQNDSYNTFSKKEGEKTIKKVHPYSTASWGSKLVFYWVMDLLNIGRTKKLEQEDLWELEPFLSTDQNYQKVSSNYSSGRIGKALANTFGWQICCSGFGYAGAMIGEYLGPYILNKFVVLMSGDQLDTNIISYWLGVLIISRVVKALCYQHFWFSMDKIKMKTRSALKAFVYKKSLSLSTASSQQKTTGDISNLYTTDVDNVTELVFLFPVLTLLPVLILGVLYTLYGILGHATLAGCFLLVLFMIVHRQISVLADKHYDLVMEAKDERMNVISELFNAIRIVKLNSWEEEFSSRIKKVRAIEMGALWKFCYAISMMIFSAWGTPIFITAITFIFYTLVFNHTLTAATAFTAVAFFRMLKYRTTFFTYLLPSLMRAKVSLSRLQEFMDLEDHNSNHVIGRGSPESENYESDGTIIAVENGKFSWPSKTGDVPLFSNLNLTVKKGDLTVIHGPVGSGKSSLCSVLLGEMKKLEGIVYVGGTVSFCLQESWIQNLTIRDNITFGSPWDPHRYNEVVKCCCLEQDLKSLTGGDLTEIGQKGINLSGGQKARINLARACYKYADIYIFDSPLSAVDAIVQNYIFSECLTKFLEEKTLILVTHHDDIIKSDIINQSIELSNGKIVENVLNPIVDSLLKMTRPKESPDATYEELSLNSVKLPSKGKLVEEENREEGRVSASVFKSYYKAIGGLPTISFLIVVQILWQLLLISSDFWLSHWTISTNKAENAGYYLSIYCALSFSSVMFVLVRALSLSYFGLKGSQKLFERMTNSLLHAPMSFFDSNPVGRQLNRYSKDMETLDMDIYFNIGSCLAMGFSFSATFITTLIITQSLWMALVIPLLGLFYCCSNLYLQSSRDIERLLKVSESPLLSFVSESIDGIKVIRAFGEITKQNFISKNNKLIDQYNTASFAQFSMLQWFGLYQQLITATVISMIGTSLVFLHGVMPSGIIGLIFSYGLQLDDCLYDMFMAWCSLENGMVSPERIDEYVHIKQEAPHVIKSTDPGKSWPMEAQIMFQNVSFRYKEEGKLILKNLNFSISSTEKIGIVGRTGAGKSSLAMTLFRIQELCSGRIYVDGIDISKIGLHTLRSQLCIVTQDPSLFVGTVRKSLDPFSHYCDNQLWEVMRKVGLHDKISSMKGKLEASLSGSNLSIGENQLFCLCRALLKKQKLIILDEATASIDYETDKQIQHLIKSEFEHSTVLTIAHRLNSVMDCDRIMVLEQGEITDFDTPANLLQEREGQFFKMAVEGGYIQNTCDQPQ